MTNLPPGDRTFAFTAAASVLVVIQAPDEQTARATYEQINTETFAIAFTTCVGHGLDDLTLADDTPELHQVDGEEPVENCPQPDCGGYVINNWCTDADCPTARACPQSPVVRP
ncbi:hypothetical protein [Streptomyces viridochromogenes]|uniref:hypothetical protein n=1 Tax=Streptomyces viridochromogenes TaxID=1938 RepID=UPI0031DED45C